MVWNRIRKKKKEKKRKFRRYNFRHYNIDLVSTKTRSTV